jgi:hypothetical protein
VNAQERTSDVTDGNFSRGASGSAATRCPQRSAFDGAIGAQVNGNFDTSVMLSDFATTKK